MVGVGNGRFDVLQLRLAAGEVVIAIFLPHLPLVHNWIGLFRTSRLWMCVVRMRHRILRRVFRLFIHSA